MFGGPGMIVKSSVARVWVAVRSSREATPEETARKVVLAAPLVLAVTCIESQDGEVRVRSSCPLDHVFPYASAACTCIQDTVPAVTGVLATQLWVMTLWDDAGPGGKWARG